MENADCGPEPPYSSRNDASIPPEFDVWPRSAELGSKTKIYTRGVPMRPGLIFNCRFGSILVPAVITSFTNGALTCFAPVDHPDIINKTVGFSIVAAHETSGHMHHHCCINFTTS